MSNDYIADYDIATRIARARSAQANAFPDMVVAAFDQVPAPDLLQTNKVGYCEATGADGAYAATVAPWPVTLAEGQSVRVKVNHTNPGGSVETFAFNAFDPKPIRDNYGQPLLAGMMTADTIAWLSYVAGRWQLDAIGTPPEGLPDVGVIRSTSAVVRPEDFEGTTEETLALAFAAGLSTGLPVRLDGAYSIATAIPTVAFTSGRLRVEGSGRIIVTANVGVAVSFHAEYPAAVSAAVSQTTHAFPGVSTPTIAATKVVASGHGCAIGDIVKIVSDDQVVPTSAVNHRRGEFAYVADVDGNDLYLPGYLLETYTTTPRLVRVRQEPRLVWDGPTFEATAGQAWTSFMLRVRGFYRPRVRTGFRNGYSVGLDISSCYMAEVDVEGVQMLNRVSSAGIAGYLVQDQASYMSRVQLAGTDARHGYTNTTPTTASPGGEPYLYGRTEGSVVTGSFVGASAAAFDTHTEAVGITFDGARSAATWGGESSAGTGIQMRGTRVKAVNCADRDSMHGALFFAQVANDCVDCELVNFQYDGAGDAIRINNSSATNDATRPRIRGGRLSTSNGRAIAAQQCVGAVIDDLLIAPTGSAAGATGILLMGDAEVLVRRLTIDLSNYSGSTFRAFGFDTGTTGNRLVVEGVKVIGASGKLQAWFSGATTGEGDVTLGGLSADAIPSSGEIINDAALVDLVLSDGWRKLGAWDFSVDGATAAAIFTNIAFDEIMVIARGVTKASTGTLNVQVSTNNGSSYKATSGDYVEIAADGQETNAAAIVLHTTNATAARSGIATLGGLKDSARKTGTVANRAVAVSVESTSDITAVKVLGSGGGNLTGGTITLMAR
jgi:hypothetical protein